MGDDNSIKVGFEVDMFLYNILLETATGVFWWWCGKESKVTQMTITLITYFRVWV